MHYIQTVYLVHYTKALYVMHYTQTVYLVHYIMTLYMIVSAGYVGCFNEGPSEFERNMWGLGAYHITSTMTVDDCIQKCIVSVRSLYSSVL